MIGQSPAIRTCVFRPLYVGCRFQTLDYQLAVQELTNEGKVAPVQMVAQFKLAHRVARNDRHAST